VAEAVPTPTKGVLGTSPPGKDSLRSAYRQPLTGEKNRSMGKA